MQIFIVGYRNTLVEKDLNDSLLNWLQMFDLGSDYEKKLFHDSMTSC